MKFRVEAECTPEEARAFLGLPDVGPLNARMVEEVTSRFGQNAALLKPDELLKTWMSFGGQAQDQFMKMMSTAASAGLSAAPPRR